MKDTLNTKEIFNKKTALIETETALISANETENQKESIQASSRKGSLDLVNLESPDGLAASNIKSSSECPHRARVGSLSEAPEFLKDNEYIHHGYRINFNSSTKVMRSLFLLHNESVNVWSHLLGVLMVLLLAIYTAIYVQAHKAELLESLHLNMTELNEDIKLVTDPVLNILPNIGNFTEAVLIKTHEYVNIVDEKVGLYQKYVKCKECFEEIVGTLNVVKDSLSKHMKDYKNKLVDESRTILEKIEDSSVGSFIEDKLKILKEKISELVEHSHIQDAPWSEIYAIDMNDKSNRLPRWPVFIFLISAAVCLGCSTIFHWFCAHSKTLHEILNRLDYAGISILIAGSCYPPYYYYMHCENVLRNIYLGFISVFAISVFFYSLRPEFTIPSKRKLRGILFLTLGLSTALPFIHLALFSHTIVGYEKPPYLLYWYLGGFSYVFGALTYILRIPERFRPGKHDIWGSSHQIFHLCVLSGVILHYFGSLDSYYYRFGYPCPA